MYKKLLLLLLGTLFLAHADVYYAKLEPVKEHIIKANVTGRVTFADEQIEGKTATRKPIILIESELDEHNMILLQRKKALLEDLVIEEKSVYEKKKIYSDSVQKLTTKSQTNKDSAFFAQALAKEQWYNEIMQLDSTTQTLLTLTKNIKDKKLIYPEWYVYKLHVKEGDFVAMGTPLLTIADISKAKLTIYLSEDDAKNYKSKELLIEDKPTPFKIERVWKVANSEHISSYEATLIVDAKERFSTLVKIELKEKR